MTDDTPRVPQRDASGKLKRGPRRTPEEIKKHREGNRRWYLKTAATRRRKSLEWARANKEHRKVYMEKWSLENEEAVKKYRKERYAKRAQEYRNVTRDWKLKHPDHVKNYQKQWYQKKGKAYREDRSLKKGDEERAYRKEYAKKNRKRMNENARIYMNRRRKEDINFKMLTTIRSRTLAFLKGRKCARSVELLGCSIEFLRNHLEVRFKPGMTWKNHGKGEGKWEVDHIRPCSAFDFSDPEQQKKCFHYSNLQPLWGYENLQKSDSVVEDF